MMSIRLWALTVCSFLAFSASIPALALNDGFYAGITADVAKFKITNDNGISFDNTQSLTAYMGFNFLPIVGVELAGRTFTDIDNERNDSEIELNQALLGVVIAGELSDAFDIFIKAHLTYGKLEITNGDLAIGDHSDMGWKYEIGMAYNFTDYLALTGKVDHSLSSYSDVFDYTVTSAGLGLQLSF